MGGWEKVSSCAMRWGRRCRHLGVALCFPLRCEACGGWREPESEASDSHGNGGLGPDLLCRFCRSAWTPIRSPLCPDCGRAFDGAGPEDHPCGDCLAAPRRFDSARAVGRYDGALRAVIHRFKYHGQVGLAPALARAMTRTAAAAWPGERFDAIVPVPLHHRRLRRRGYNQAELLARGLSDGLGIPVVPHALVRIRPTQPQSGLGAADRVRNLAGAFIKGSGAAITDARVMVVDDVYTTGTTADAAARVLRAAGAARIHVLTVARTH